MALREDQAIAFGIVDVVNVEDPEKSAATMSAIDRADPMCPTFARFDWRSTVLRISVILRPGGTGSASRGDRGPARGR